MTVRSRAMGTGDNRVPRCGVRGRRLRRRGSAGIFRTLPAHSAVGVSGTSRQRCSHCCCSIPARNPRLRDRSPPTIVTRTSSVRAGVGDDGGTIPRVRSTVRKLEK